LASRLIIRVVLTGFSVLAFLMPGTAHAAHNAVAHRAEAMLTPSMRTNTRTGADPRAYWGAAMEGDETYAYYYGGPWGDAPWDANTWSKFESNAGKKVSVVHWAIPPPWKSRFADFKSTFQLVRKAGDLNAVDMSTGSVRLKRIARGSGCGRRPDGVTRSSSVLTPR
jgi:hypothetical protein